MASRRYRPIRFPASTGTFFLARASQVALWEHELTGQISDGMWENSGPSEHYAFWCRLKPVLAPAGARVGVETPCEWLCTRDRYGFTSLYTVEWPAGVFCIRDRMVKLGRLALACELDGHECGYEQRLAAEELPETWQAYLSLRADEAERVGSAKEQEERTRLLNAVPKDLARTYYEHLACKAYGLKQMKADVKAIKEAMKQRRPPEVQPTE